MEQNKFTQKSLEAIQEAQQMAIKNGNPQIEELHLHAALLANSNDLVFRVLSLAGVDAQKLRNEVLEAVGRLPVQEGATQLYPSTQIGRAHV